MNSATIKKWAKYYFSLAAINIWNGSMMYFKVLIAAGGAGAIAGYDIRTVTTDAFLWTWLSAVIVHIIIEINKNLIPGPTPPTKE